jgi:ribosome-binding factor A
MEKQETPRQKKINTVLQQEIASLLQGAIRKGGVTNLMVSITKVQVTSDLSIAKIYLSIFPNDNALNYFENIKDNRFHLRHDLSQRMKNQLRRIPELKFYLDDSLDYIENIEKDLSNGESPIKIVSNQGKQKKNKH